MVKAMLLRCNINAFVVQYQRFCRAITLIFILSYSRYWHYYPFILLEEGFII